MVKTRIKVELREDGSLRYFPQKKGWLFWCMYYKTVWGEIVYTSFDSEEEAQRFLQKEIDKHKTNNTVDVSYRKYP